MTNISKEVKLIVKFNKSLYERIRTAFNDTLLEIREEGLDIRNKTTNGEGYLKAFIEGECIEIPIMRVIDELRLAKGRPVPMEITDSAIKNAVNRLILEELTL